MEREVFEDVGAAITRNLSLTMTDGARSSLTLTETSWLKPPASITPTEGRTLYLSGEVVLICEINKKHNLSYDHSNGQIINKVRFCLLVYWSIYICTRIPLNYETLFF